MEDYGVLGIPVNSDMDTVKSAYKRLVLKHHPDKKGNESDFIRITRAYNNILENRERGGYISFEDFYEKDDIFCRRNNINSGSFDGIKHIHEYDSDGSRITEEVKFYTDGRVERVIIQTVNLED